MMRASDSARAQRDLKRLLERNGFIVEKEWPIATASNDIFRNTRYAPRLDLAVAPFNTSTGQARADAQKIRQAAALCPLVKRIEECGKSSNCLFRKNCQNPRCLLAIEIEFTRTSKYMLGDFTNASLMGLIGLVIGPQETVTRLKELGRYMRRVVEVRKAPPDFLANVVCFELQEFKNLLRA